MTILETAKPAESASRENYRIKALLIGHSGSGKTTSGVLTLPGRKLVIDYDGRSASLAGAPDVDVIELLEQNPKSPAAWDKAEKLKDELWTAVRKKELKWDSIVEDGLSSMSTICMYWALLLDPKRGLGGSPAKQHYGPQMKNLQDHVRSMINLPVNYVLTAHFNALDDEETGAIHYFVKVFGKQMKTDVPGWFNEVYYCYHTSNEKAKRETYLWHTSGFGKFDFMKSSINNPAGKYWTDPIEIDLSSEPAGFQKLLELRFGKEKGDETK